MRFADKVNKVANRCGAAELLQKHIDVVSSRWAGNMTPEHVHMPVKLHSCDILCPETLEPDQ